LCVAVEQGNAIADLPGGDVALKFAQEGIGDNALLAHFAALSKSSDSDYLI